MADTTNQQQATQEEPWSPFDGLGPYRGNDNMKVDYDDDSPIPEEVLQKPAAPQQQQQSQQQPQQPAGEGKESESPKKGGGVLEPFFDTDYFEDAKEVGSEEKGEEPATEEAAGPGRRPLTPEEREARHISALYDAFVEDYGWKDIPEENRPRTAREFTEFVTGIIAQNQTPRYAHPELQALDEYVRKGGDLANYFKSVSEMNYDALTLDTEYDQKRAVAEVLRLQGYPTDAIKEKVEDYAKAGLLQKESADALARLKTYSNQMKQAQLQQFYKSQQQEEQITNQFIDVTAQTLQQMPDVLGAPLTNKERRELFEYIFKQNEQGYSQFMIDYSSNPTNIITAAYLCKHGKNAIKAMEGQAQARAIDKYSQMIRQQDMKSRGRTRAAAAASQQGSKHPASKFVGLAKI